MKIKTKNWERKQNFIQTKKDTRIEVETVESTVKSEQYESEL